MGRDRHLPLGAIWGHVNHTFQTPANAAIAVGVLAALPILVVGPLGGFFMSIAATGLIYLSYFLCNLGVLMARRGLAAQAGLVQPRQLGHAHQHPRPHLGRPDARQLRPLAGHRPVRRLRRRWPRVLPTHASGSFFTPFGNTIEGLPTWPMFEVIVGDDPGPARSTTSSSVRGEADDIESADAVTGEAVIG